MIGGVNGDSVTDAIAANPKSPKETNAFPSEHLIRNMCINVQISIDVVHQITISCWLIQPSVHIAKITFKCHCLLAINGIRTRK